MRFRPVGASPFPLRRTALCSSGGDGAGSTLGDGLGLPRSRARRAPVRLPRCPMCGKAHWVCSLDRLASGSLPRAEKKSQGPDSNPRPSDPQPSTLTTRTQDLDASKVSIFIPWSAHGASSSRGLEEGGGRRPPRGRLQIRLSPNGGALHWRGAHWSVLLAACWLLHVGLFALPVAPRGAVRSVASSRGVVASMLVAGAASTMQDLLPSSCGLLQLGWGFVVRSGVGWGFPRGLWLCPDRVDRPPEMVSLSARSCDWLDFFPAVRGVSVNEKSGPGIEPGPPAG